MYFKAFILLLFCGLVYYFFFSPSYKLANDAKEAYTKQNYELAYTLANDALKEDLYNKKAFSISSQAKQRIQIQKFLESSENLYKNALALLNQTSLTEQEFLQLKWICEEFNAKREELTFFNNPTQEEAKNIQAYTNWFKDLESKLQKTKQP
ncbi:hypothetical protein [Helicobacter burdigaliensis]|uniref:hypothetical protein n=1 Tax=Helicobacter burdigaliensis TaxID=2315334 RepID=UPI000EF7133F|nr:hypothetical protein [Helicobacter burdigaliensis]